MQNYIGKQIDRYRIIERLGTGGMAVVYKAYDTRLERDVALKLIRVDEIPPSQHERLMKRFEREAKAMARFSHPNIVPVHDYGEVDGTPYLVMEFVPGGTLKERINRPVLYPQAIQWLIPIADALHYAHERNVFHRDVKPSNILFDSEGRPLLTDFGIAKILETDEATLTGTGLGVGTPEYMAPEQWQGKTSAATDQYALGVVFYELITGRKPYAADTPAAIILMQATEPFAPPSGLVQGIPENVEKVLYKALSRDSQDRYESMEAFARAMSGLLANAKTVEPVRPKQTAQPVEPAPEVAAATNSKRVTRDALDATPAGGIPQPTGSSKVEKKELPKWALWTGLGIIALVLITLAFVLGSKSADLPTENNTQVVSIVTETEEATTTPTETTVPTVTATVTLTPEPILAIGSTMINEIDGAEMVYVPAGEYSSVNSGLASIYVKDYWIYKFEVTNKQYHACIEAGICNDNITNYPIDQYPATSMSRYSAIDYCIWAGGNLPTYNEWHKAAFDSDGRQYPWGNEYPTSNLANFSDYIGEAMPVGSYPNGESPYGVQDMAGNVWEFLLTPAYYYSSKGYWVGYLAGGAYDSEQRFLNGFTQALKYSETAEDIGFRCVIDLEP